MEDLDFQRGGQSSNQLTNLGKNPGRDCTSVVVNKKWMNIKECREDNPQQQ